MPFCSTFDRPIYTVDEFNTIYAVVVFRLFEDILDYAMSLFIDSLKKIDVGWSD